MHIDPDARAEVIRGEDTVKISLSFSTPVNDEDIIILAAIRDNDILKSVIVREVTDMYAEFDITDGYEDADIMIYIWDKQMRPYMAAVPAEKNGSERE